MYLSSHPHVRRSRMNTGFRRTQAAQVFCQQREIFRLTKESPLNREDGWTVDLPWIGQYILDEHGDAVPAKGLFSWGQWLQDHPNERHLAQDQIGDARVSTIFLALDYGAVFIPGEMELDPTTYEPTLWETMVFGGPHHLDMERYTSRAEALEGHRKIVERLRATPESRVRF
jgi:hypothetical protein